MKIETKFNIGDSVFYNKMEFNPYNKPCSDCEGTGWFQTLSGKKHKCSRCKKGNIIRYRKSKVEKIGEITGITCEVQKNHIRNYYHIRGQSSYPEIELRKAE